MALWQTTGDHLSLRRQRHIYKIELWKNCYRIVKNFRTEVDASKADSMHPSFYGYFLSRFAIFLL